MFNKTSSAQALKPRKVLHKKISQRNLAHVGMAQCRNALADKVQKQEVPCTQRYALHNMATLFNNHSYKSSSISLCAWHFLSLYFVNQCIPALSHPYMG